MKIALLNGSPRSTGSNSGFLLERLKQYLGAEVQIVELRVKGMSDEQYNQISECDSIVLAFPLYVDSVPAHVMEFMLTMVEKVEKPLSVYVIANNGFYEGKQNRIALEVIANWCVKAGYIWKQGLGIGGTGKMLQAIKNIPFGQGPNTDIGEAFTIFVQNVLANRSGENIFTTPNFPKFAYKKAAHMGWRIEAKNNGLKTKDILRKIQ